MGTVIIWLIYIKLMYYNIGAGVDLSPLDLKMLHRACPKIYGELKTSTEYPIDFMSLYRCWEVEV